MKTILLAMLMCLFFLNSLLAAEIVVPPPRFDISGYDIAGNSILTSVELDMILASFKGPDRDFGTVQQAMEALENAYRSHGYNFVSVTLPEQEMKDGKIRLNIVETRIRNVVIEGNSHFSTENILKSFPSVVKGTPPLVGEISNNLRAVNENPAKKVTLNFKPAEEDDQVDVMLKVADEKKWKAALTFDNTGNAQTGDYRMGMMLQNFNLHNLDHIATFQYTMSPDHADKVTSISASYRIPLYQVGDTLDFFGGYSDIDSGTISLTGSDFSYTASNINGKGIIAGTRYNHTLPRIGPYAQKLILGFDYRFYENNSLVDISVQGNSISQPSGSKLLLHPFSATYSASLAMEKGEAGVYTGFLFNPVWGDYGGPDDFQGAKAEYFIFRYGTSLGYALPADWQARAVFNGQITEFGIAAYEQMGNGGPSTNRGYDERIASNDNGFGGSLEIYTPDMGQLFKIPMTQLRMLAFYDDGYTWRAEPVNGDDGGVRLSSAGGGIRLGLAKNFTVSADWGVALESVTSGTTHISRGDSRVHFKAALLY